MAVVQLAFFPVFSVSAAPKELQEDYKELRTSRMKKKKLKKRAKRGQIRIEETAEPTNEENDAVAQEREPNAEEEDDDVDAGEVEVTRPASPEATNGQQAVKAKSYKSGDDKKHEREDVLHHHQRLAELMQRKNDPSRMEGTSTVGINVPHRIRFHLVSSFCRARKEKVFRQHEDGPRCRRDREPQPRRSNQPGPK